jgi:hypothetical protein
MKRMLKPTLLMRFKCPLIVVGALPLVPPDVAAAKF